MPKVRAIHTCIVDGQVYYAGAEFEASAKVVQALVDAGAAEVVEPKKKAAKPKKAADKKAEPKTGEGNNIL